MQGASQITSAIQQLDNVTQANSEVSVNISDTVQSLTQMVGGVQSDISFFKILEGMSNSNVLHFKGGEKKKTQRKSGGGDDGGSADGGGGFGGAKESAAMAAGAEEST